MLILSTYKAGFLNLFDPKALHCYQKYSMTHNSDPGSQNLFGSKINICSNSQKNTEWVKIYFMPKIMRILSKDHVL